MQITTAKMSALCTYLQKFGHLGQLEMERSSEGESHLPTWLSICYSRMFGLHSVHEAQIFIAVNGVEYGRQEAAEKKLADDGAACQALERLCELLVCPKTRSANN